MGKRRFLAFMSLTALLLAGTGTEASPLSWYRGMQEGQTEAQAPGQDIGTDGGVSQADLGLSDEKIYSLGGLCVGRTVIPAGWTIRTQDLMLGTESIICPNALYMTAESPDGSCIFHYLSRREFQESYAYLQGFDAHSADDTFDNGELMHMLDYRDASASCDLMAQVLSGASSLSMEREWEEDPEEAEKIASLARNYDTSVRDLIGQGNALFNISREVQWSELTAATRTYSYGTRKMTVRACSEGYELFTPMGYDGSSYTKTCYWAMPAVFALETDAASHESFLDAFEVFCYFTSVSREYEIMREKNAEELVEAVVRARNDQPGYSEDEQQRRFDEIEESTVGSGDTYSVNEGWTDYIRDQTDYRTSDGTHVKIPSSYDHVFEGDDGNIYVGSSVDGPAGSTELTPTQIGY